MRVARGWAARFSYDKAVGRLYFRVLWVTSRLHIVGQHRRHEGRLLGDSPRSSKEESECDIRDCLVFYCAYLLCSAVWNSLPKSVVNSDSLTVFKSQLKTFLFSRAFPLFKHTAWPQRLWSYDVMALLLLLLLLLPISLLRCRFTDLGDWALQVVGRIMRIEGDILLLLSLLAVVVLNQSHLWTPKSLVVTPLTASIVARAFLRRDRD